jgi:hypothetical protein
MDTPRNVTIEVPSITINLSPDGYRYWAREFLRCRLAYIHPDGFSPVPYFLVCRAIELALKAHHLESMKQSEVKQQFSHNLVKTYDALPPDKKHLSQQEYALLKAANKVYFDKGFEYFPVAEVVTGFKSAPRLNELDALAQKLVGDGI